MNVHVKPALIEIVMKSVDPDHVVIQFHHVESDLVQFHNVENVQDQFPNVEKLAHQLQSQQDVMSED